MATAVLNTKTETVMTPTEVTTKESVTLTLTMEEAYALRCIVGRATGAPRKSLRGFCDRLWYAFNDIGLNKSDEPVGFSDSFNNIDFRDVPGLNVEREF
jgi:hypothetical protein